MPNSSNNEKKYALQKEVVQIANGPKEGRLQDRTKSRPIQETVDFTFTVSAEDGKTKVGKRVTGYVKFIIPIPNPKTRTYIDGEQWYCGNFSILPDAKKGTSGETRAFVYEVLGQKGLLSKRGTAFSVIPCPPELKEDANVSKFKKLFDIKD
ncbi:MAG: hypothetical protein KA052_01060 [Candidatus Pacebacteria bacterium]|nr:hypothetical protein [Candidatus Paceibacterota bacterium]